MSIITKYSVFLILFFISALVQQNMFPRLHIAGNVPNFVFTLFFVLLFFQNIRDHKEGFFLAIVAGSITDLFSTFYPGTSIVILLTVCGVFKITVYFLNQMQEKYQFIYFVLLYSLFSMLYNIAYNMAAYFPHILSALNPYVFVQLAYSLPIAVLVFSIYQYIIIKSKANRQLTLFRNRLISRF